MSLEIWAGEALNSASWLQEILVERKIPFFEKKETEAWKRQIILKIALFVRYVPEPCLDELGII